MITEGILNIKQTTEYDFTRCCECNEKNSGHQEDRHTGTLDPMATGVLPICIGRSTRIMEYLDLEHETIQMHHGAGCGDRYSGCLGADAGAL